MKNISWPVFFCSIEYDRPYRTNVSIIPASNLAPKGLCPTLERVKGVPEKLEMQRLSLTK